MEKLKLEDFEFQDLPGDRDKAITDEMERLSKLCLKLEKRIEELERKVK